MKLLLVFLFLFTTPIYAQSLDDNLDISPYFTAIIVSDLDSSIEWYGNVFGYEVINRNEAEHIGLVQANLKTETSLLELIQLETSLSIEEAIPNYNPLNRIQSIFKIGFKVDDFDSILERIQMLDVEVLGDVVSDPVSNTRMIILLDPDGNRVQLFEQ